LCRSSYDSLGVGSPVPSLAGTGLSHCGTPQSAQTASAANTPQGAAAGTAAALAGLPPGAFMHGVQLAAMPGHQVQSPMHQHPVFEGSAAAAAVGAATPAEAGSIRVQQPTLLSLNTWVNTPMGEQQSPASYQQSPQLGSPASRPSSPSVRQGTLLGQAAAAAAAPEVLLGQAAAAAAAAAAGDGSGSSGLTAAVIRQFTPQLQRCMSAGGGLTRSTSCGSNLAAAGAEARAGPRILSLPGVLTPQPGTASSGHVTRSMSGTVSPNILAAGNDGGLRVVSAST
jgi:hypothetical protein